MMSVISFRIVLSMSVLEGQGKTGSGWSYR